MSELSIRRIQISCAALAHIPLVALAALLVRDGLGGDISIIAITFAATLVTAILLVAYLDRAVATVQRGGAEAVNRAG